AADGEASPRLVSAEWVLTMDGAPIRDGAVALDATGTVTDVGGRRDLLARNPAAAEERASGVLMPGLVNAHTHLELSALAGRVPGGDGVVAWTRRLLEALAVVGTDERREATERAAVAALAAAAAAAAHV